MIDIKCRVCNKEKTIPNRELKVDGNCCSYACRSILLKKSVERPCEYCGKLFYEPPCRITETRGKFCSSECSYSRKREKLIGKKVGKLTIIKYSHLQAKKNSLKQVSMFLCKCDCGNEKYIFGGDLTTKKVTSCGCKPSRHNSKIGNAAFNVFYNGYKAKANNRGITFNLTKEEFKTITSLDCQYCGISPIIRKLKIVEKLNGKYPCNGIDRVDSGSGYTVENSVPCCSICNTMKMALSEKDFLSHIEKISAFQKNKGKEFPPSYLTVVA